MELTLTNVSLTHRGLFKFDCSDSTMTIDDGMLTQSVKQNCRCPQNNAIDAQIDFQVTHDSKSNATPGRTVRYSQPRGDGHGYWRDEHLESPVRHSDRRSYQLCMIIKGTFVFNWIIASKLRDELSTTCEKNGSLRARIVRLVILAADSFISELVAVSRT